MCEIKSSRAFHELTKIDFQRCVDGDRDMLFTHSSWYQNLGTFMYNVTYSLLKFFLVRPCKCCKDLSSWLLLSGQRWNMSRNGFQVQCFFSSPVAAYWRLLLCSNANNRPMQTCRVVTSSVSQQAICTRWSARTNRYLVKLTQFGRSSSVILHTSARSCGNQPDVFCQSLSHCIKVNCNNFSTLLHS